MWLTAGMSRPRAATSEATSSVTSFLRKASSAAVRSGWAHIAVQFLHREAVALERAIHGRDFALAIAEHDAVLEAFRRTDQLAQNIALVGGVASALDELLGNRAGSGRRAAETSTLIRIVEELLGDAPDFGSASSR